MKMSMSPGAVILLSGSLLAFVNGQLGLDLLLLLLIVSPLVSALTVAVLAGRRSFRLFAT